MMPPDPPHRPPPRLPPGPVPPQDTAPPPSDAGRWPVPPPGPFAVARRDPAAAEDDAVGPEDCDAVIRLLDLVVPFDAEAAALARGCLPRSDSTFGAGLALFLATAATGCRAWLPSDVIAQLEGLDDGLVLDECDDALTSRQHHLGGRVWQVQRVPLLDPSGTAVLPAGLLCATSFDADDTGGFTVVLQARPATLGAVQLTATLAGRQLDLALRTAGGLPAALLAELHESARLALEACLLRGTLTVGPLGGDWLRFDTELNSDVAL